MLDRNPDNCFADVEQSGFDPGNFVPGIGPSHGDRLGINHTTLPVNGPHATEAANYGRDGAMRTDGNGGRSKNCELNSFDGSVFGRDDIIEHFRTADGARLAVAVKARRAG